MTYLRFSLQLIKQLAKTFSTVFCISMLLYAGAANALSVDMSTSPNVATMLQNFSAAVPNLMRLVTALAYVMGFFFVIKGVLELKAYGESRSMMSQEHHLSKPLIYLTVGALLIYLPGSVQTGMATFFTSPNPYGYLPTSDTQDSWTALTNSVFMIIQLVGTISFIRGLVILTHVSGHGQPGTFAKAIAHIVAGVLCINLYQFLQAIFSTLGLGTLSP